MYKFVILRKDALCANEAPPPPPPPQMAPNAYASTQP